MFHTSIELRHGIRSNNCNNYNWNDNGNNSTTAASTTSATVTGRTTTTTTTTTTPMTTTKRRPTNLAANRNKSVVSSKMRFFSWQSLSVSGASCCCCLLMVSTQFTIAHVSQKRSPISSNICVPTAIQAVQQTVSTCVLQHINDRSLCGTQRFSLFLFFFSSRSIKKIDWVILVDRTCVLCGTFQMHIHNAYAAHVR